MLSLLLELVIGALIGYIASKIMKTDLTLLMYVVLGIVGSFAGRLVFGLIGLHATNNSIGDVLISVVGACIVIFIAQVIMNKKTK